MPYIGKSPLHGNYSKLDSISGSFNGSTTQFALATNGISVTPVTEAALLISMNGVIQEPTTAYTVSGTNITFTSAPASTDTFYGVALGEQLAIGTPSDSTITSAKLSGNLVTPGTLDVNGQELILDANGNTSITADTDDQIDFKLSGADDFRMTANNFNVLSGSTLTIDSGATITNSGTASGFGSNVPTSADGQALGSASAEWSDLYLADGGVIYFGNDQDVTVTHDPDDGLFLKSKATADDNPFLLTLQTGETDMAADDVMGKIAFQAPDEGTGTDAILVAAAIQARAEGDFSSSSNATSLDFMTGSSAAASTNMTLDSAGKLTVKGELAIAAATGVLETNANFTNQVIFGPAVDGKSWNGLWNSASLFSSLMLATLEDPGSAAQVNIWDLTAQTGGTISTSPLATVDISGAATPTSIDAAMGYIIVGHEDGITIIDPHDGSWAARTQGWPRSLSTSTVPALDSNDVIGVAAGFSDQPLHDSRTGGPIPTFAVKYASGESNMASIIKEEGNVWDITGTSTAGIVGFFGHHFVFPSSATETRTFPISKIIANMAFGSGDSFLASAGYPDGLPITNAYSSAGGTAVGAGDDGVNISTSMVRGHRSNVTNYGWSSINRTYNSGFTFSNTRGAWLANSKTADRTYKGNTLTENGTVTEGAVASGAELNGYSGFSTSNYFSRAADADWASIGDNSVYLSVWFKTSGNSAFEEFVTLRKASPPVRIDIYMEASGVVGFECYGDAGERNINSTGTYDDGAWHKLDGVHLSSTDRKLYVDGVLVNEHTLDSGSLTGSEIILGIGARGHNGDNPATTSTLALARVSAGSVIEAPRADQIREMYEIERPMFDANAECLLQSGTTDAVIDVSVDPLGSGKILVTQTDAITIFDGLVVDSKPTVNSGASEKGKLWGDLRTEQNAANVYVTTPAHDQAQVNEMVRGITSDFREPVDMGKAKAWLKAKSHTTIEASLNIDHVVDTAAGDLTVFWATPFKSDNYAVVVGTNDGYGMGVHGDATQLRDRVLVRTRDITSTGQPTADTTLLFVVAYGELENE